MSLRTRVALCGLGLLLCVLFAILLVAAPPDGVERSEWGQFIGRFHPLVVHFPIALVLLTALLECATFFASGRHLQPFAAFVLALAAGSAVMAVSLGWLLGRSGGYEGQLVTRHMWGGIALATVLVLSCAVRGWNPWFDKAAVLLAVVLMVWTADHGGRLTHGANFLIEHMPPSLRTLLGVSAPAPKPALANAANGPSWNPVPVTTKESVAFFESRVEPIFRDKCTTCHGPEKKKGKLRLDSFDYVMAGGKDGLVVKPGDPKGSDLFRRITLPRDHKDAMPAEGKPRLSVEQIKVIEFWIASGAAKTVAAEEARAAPAPPKPKPMAPPASPDYHPRLEEIHSLEAKLGVQLVARSQDAHDGLILRTVGAPERCDDAALAALKPIGDLIVDAELARTKVTDDGMKTVGSFQNLVSLDLSHTIVSSRGLGALESLKKLESLNLTGTRVDDEGLGILRRHKPGLRHLYFFETTTGPSASSRAQDPSTEPK